MEMFSCGLLCDFFLTHEVSAQTPLSQLMSKMKRSLVVDEETWDSVTRDLESREAASFSTPERPEQKLKVSREAERFSAPETPEQKLKASREAATFSSLETPEQKLKAELESTKYRLQLQKDLTAAMRSNLDQLLDERKAREEYIWALRARIDQLSKVANDAIGGLNEDLGELLGVLQKTSEGEETCAMDVMDVAVPVVEVPASSPEEFPETQVIPFQGMAPPVLPPAVDCGQDAQPTDTLDSILMARWNNYA